MPEEKPERTTLTLTLMENGSEYPEPIVLSLIYDRKFCYFEGTPPHPLTIVVGDPSDTLSEDTVLRFDSITVDDDGSLTLGYKEKP